MNRRAASLTRDQRLQVLILNRNRLGYREITGRLWIKCSQARGTERSGRTSLQPHTGRPRVLSSEKVNELEAFACSTRATRQMGFLKLSLHFSWQSVEEFAMRNALLERGYERRLRRCSLLAENTRLAKRIRAENHSYWQEQWSYVVWSDETWINDDRIISSHDTRKFCHLVP